MKRILTLALQSAVVTLLAACAAPPHEVSYSVRAAAPRNREAVRVKVSLSRQIVYVMEKDEVLMAAATCVGLPEKPTPRGQFRITNKMADKRSNSYGFFVNGRGIEPGEAAHPRPGRFVGYPMPYWCEFSPGYGFHAGYVHPVPRTHGCLRLHNTVAPKFFALVKEGTPVNIAYEQPEDAQYALKVARPTDYLDPDPPAAFMISQRVFAPAAEPLLEGL
jgi:hypothetical protein